MRGLETVLYYWSESYGTAEKGWKETAVREGLGNHAKKLDPSGESNKQPSQKPGSPADSFCLPHTIFKKKKEIQKSTEPSGYTLSQSLIPWGLKLQPGY